MSEQTSRPRAWLPVKRPHPTPNHNTPKIPNSNKPHPLPPDRQPPIANPPPTLAMEAVNEAISENNRQQGE